MTFQRSSLRALSVATAFAFSTAAQADLRVNFYEGAPKDRIQIVNTGVCTISGSSVTIDLSQSQGGLIFDVTASGQGVEVYQPFEIVQGENALARIPTVMDGQKQVVLEIVSLAPNEAIAFTIDVDDTIGQREITVTGSEFAGTTAAYTSGESPILATFSSGPEAIIPIQNCS